MAQLQTLTKLRALGKLEQVSAACHHLSFFNNVGVSALHRRTGASLGTVTDIRQLVYTAVATVLDKHAILFATLVDEGTPSVYFAGLPRIDLSQCVCFIERKGSALGKDGQDQELDAILQEQHNTSFKMSRGELPLWRLLILKSPGVEDEFTASFIFHHSIGDGMSGLVFHDAFQAALHTASSAAPLEYSTIIEPKGLRLVPSLEDLHPLPVKEAPPSAAQPFQEWTGGVIRAPCESRYKTLYLSPNVTGRFALECKSNGVSVTSGLASVLLTTLFGLVPSETQALTCIIPVSLRPWLNLPSEEAKSAIGVYIDAFQVKAQRPAALGEGAATIRATAHEISKQIAAYVTGNAAPSGEPYTAVAAFKHIPDITPVVQSAVGNSRDAALEVSNLGVFSGAASSSIWQVGRVTFSRSSVASGSAVTASVVSGGDAGLAVGFSWQDGVVEDAVVAELVQGVGSYFEQYGC